MSNEPESLESIGSTALSAHGFSRFAKFITEELGIKMPESKLTMVQSRLLRRVRELRLKSVEEYGEYFFNTSDCTERDQFINAITTNKTEFFRESEHFDYLTEVALPNLVAGTGFPPRIKAWSAGCSTGEEPYTLAMVLSEYAVVQPGFDYAILATDVSTRVLDHARAGIYQEPQIDPVPPQIRRKYLLRSKDSSQKLVRVVPDLRSRITFHRLNFMEGEYRVNDLFDVIFFRNVLIYFDRERQESVVNKLCRNLIPGGYLFVGHSESLNGLDIPVRCVQTSIFRKPL